LQHKHITGLFAPTVVHMTQSREAQCFYDNLSFLFLDRIHLQTSIKPFTRLLAMSLSEMHLTHLDCCPCRCQRCIWHISIVVHVVVRDAYDTSWLLSMSLSEMHLTHLDCACRLPHG